MSTLGKAVAAPVRRPALPAAALVLALLAAPTQTWLVLGGDLSEYLRSESPPGQMAYVLSKLCALYAVELLWLQVMLGLLRPRGDGGNGGGVAVPMAPAPWRRLHAGLGAATLAATALHVGLFVVATSLRNRTPALDLLLPWGHGVYRTWVAFGAAGLWLLVVAVAAQRLWRRQRLRRLRWHRLTLLATTLVAVHSLTIGSESRASGMGWMYMLMGTTLAIALLMRRMGRGRTGTRSASS